MGFRPDFGNKLKSRGFQDGAIWTFMPFQLFNLLRLDTGGFSTMADVEFEGEPHAVSLDFDSDIFNRIVEFLPAQLANQIKQSFARPGPCVAQFPSPVNVVIDAKLGNEVKNDEEEYIPMVITNVGQYGA